MLHVILKNLSVNKFAPHSQLHNLSNKIKIRYWIWDATMNISCLQFNDLISMWALDKLFT